MAEWTQVTVSREVWAELQRFAQRIGRAVELGLTDSWEVTERAGKQRGNGISVSQVIKVLLERDRMHRLRARAARARRRAARELERVALANLAGELLPRDPGQEQRQEELAWLLDSIDAVAEGRASALPLREGGAQ